MRETIPGRRHEVPRGRSPDPLHDSHRPPLRGQIGPQTDFGRRETRPTEPREAHRRTSSRPTGLKRNDHHSAPNQTANASDQRRALTARPAEAEGATPRAPAIGFPQAPSSSTSVRPSRPPIPSAALRSRTPTLQCAPEESHEAHAHGGATRTPARNVLPRQVRFARTLLAEGRHVSSGCDGGPPVIVRARGEPQTWGSGRARHRRNDWRRRSSLASARTPASASGSIRSGCESGSDRAPGPFRSGDGALAGVASALTLSRALETGRRGLPSAARTVSGGSGVSPGWRAVA